MLFSKKNIPTIRLHKASGQAYVNLSGKRVYLGKYGTSSAQMKYDRTLSEWLASGRALPLRQDDGVLVVEVLARYWNHAEQWYRTPEGNAARSLDRVKLVIADVRKIYGDIEAADFSPLSLKALRETWINRGLARKTINDYTGEVKKIFRWAVSEELIGPAVYQALSTVEGLRAGRSQAKEPKRVLPVPLDHVHAIKDHVSRQIWALIQLQLLTGARSSEVVFLRPIDINTEQAIWIVHLGRHKTAHHGKTRTLYMGPKAQEVIRPFLNDRPISSYLFSPRDAITEQKSQARTHRRPNQKADTRQTARVVRDHYDKDSYARAVRRACDAAKVPRWHPHRLRHNHATEVRKISGIEASVALGHSRINTTELYAEKNTELAIQIAQELG